MTGIIPEPAAALLCLDLAYFEALVSSSPGQSRIYLLVGLILGLLAGLAIGSISIGGLVAAALSPAALASLLFMLIAAVGYLIGRLRG
jgi:hypothetical protein